MKQTVINMHGYLRFQGILDWVMDAKKQGNKDVRERILLLQKEKDEVGRLLCSSVVNSSSSTFYFRHNVGP